MPRKLETDRWLFLITVALSVIGAVMVFSASAVTAREQYGNGYYFLLRQLVWFALGLAGMFALMNIDYRKLREPQFVFPFLFAVLLMLGRRVFPERLPCHASLVPFGPCQSPALRTGQARRDPLSGLAARNAQPPAQLRCKRRPPHAGSSSGLRLLMLGLVLLEPDLGTALEIFLIAFGMLFVAGLSEKYILASGALAVPGILHGHRARFLSLCARNGLPASRRRSPRARLPACPIADRRRLRRVFSESALMESKQKLF